MTHEAALWYKHAFDADYLKLYAHRGEREARGAVELFASQLPSGYEGPALDLACGGGRHSAAMLELGFETVGVDLSSELLLRAMIDLDGYAAARADMRRLPFASGSFGAVANFFTSFGYFSTDDENLGVAEEIARTLRPGGLLLWDHINPAKMRSTFASANRRELSDGSRVEETRGIDEERRRVAKRIHLTRADGDERVYHESVRFYEPDEAVALFEEAGFEVLRRFGDYDANAPFERDSPRQILLCRKAE